MSVERRRSASFSQRRTETVIGSRLDATRPRREAGSRVAACVKPYFFLWCLPTFWSSLPLPLWWFTYATHWPWFLKDGLLKFFQPPFLHCALLVGGPTFAAAS